MSAQAQATHATAAEATAIRASAAQTRAAYAATAQSAAQAAPHTQAQAAAPTRHTAQPDASVPPATRPHSRRRPATVGGVHLGQIFCWEVAVAAVVASLGRPLWVLATSATLAATLLVVTTVRVRHRWLYQWIGVRLRYGFRTRSHDLHYGEDRATSLLGAVSGGAAVSSLEVDGQPMGIIDHAGGVTAVLEPATTDAGLVSEHSAALPSPVSLLPFAEAGDPVVTAQLVLHCTPAPMLGSEASAPGASYQKLTGGRVPAQRRAWIALQVMRTADGYSEDELRQSLTSAVRRLRRRLDKDGTPVRVLDRAEAADVLLKLTHTDAAPDGAELRERWRSWDAAGMAQACFRIRRWPDLAGAAGRDLLGRLSMVPSRATTIALATRRAGTDIEAELVIKVAAVGGRELATVTDALTDAAAACGASLDRLDGEHVHGVAGSLPFGGFAS